MEKLGKPEPVMNFGSNTDKFKSGFGKDGAKIQTKSSQKDYGLDFGESQRLNRK